MEKVKINGFVLVFVWCAVLASSLGVVYTTHSTRQATQTLESLRNEATALQVEAGQFLLERSTLSTYARIEQLASNELEMKVPKSSQIMLVKP